MAIAAEEIFSETEEKLVALESKLHAWVGTEPGRVLLGKVRELLERCRALQQLGDEAATRAIGDLIIEVTAAERISMGAVTCAQHPLSVATRASSDPLCRACCDQLVATKSSPGIRDRR